jgi:hypothetical protein
MTDTTVIDAPVPVSGDVPAPLVPEVTPLATHVLTPLNVRDSLSFALRQSDYINALTPAPAGAAITVNAPTTAKYVLFSANGDFYCRITANAAGSAVVAAVPAAAVSDGSGSERNAAMRTLPDDQSYISVISPTGGATIITLQFFKS